MTRQHARILLLGAVIALPVSVPFVVLPRISPTTTNPLAVSPGPLALAGDWVTRPNGARVCRLSQDLQPWDNFGQSAYWRRTCTLWTETLPVYGTPVPPWIRNAGVGGWQVHIGDRWVP